MTSHTSHHQNESSPAIQSNIPVELQLLDNPHQNHKTSYSLTNSNVENLESANVTDIDADARRIGDGIRSTSDTEAELQAEDPERVYQQLKPVDGGPAAWRLLIAAFVFEAILWGFPISFGVFQDYYFTLPQFTTSKSQIALIGTISQGLCYLGAPLSASLTKRFPKHQTHQIWLGLPICILGLVAGSFCDSVQGLIWTQGVMYGCGFLILTYPIISMINEWWIARKGMAFGLISAASGVSGAGMPFIIQFLLEKYGYKTALRIIAVGITILTVPLLPLLKGRLPPSERSRLARTNWGFLKNKLFYIYGSATLIYGMGFFYPGVYLPSFATNIGLSGTQGAAILAVMSVAQVAGQFACGYLSDKNFSVNALAVGCTIMATISSFVLWGFAKSMGLLIAYGIMYGFFGYGFSTMRVAMGKLICSDPGSVVSIYSIFICLQGVGNVLVGPISGGLLGEKVVLGGYGVERYRDMVIYTGCCMAGCAGVIGGWWLRPRGLVSG
ncbi:putative mfs monocarboxylate transporter protein [Botrytis fragariae]|uniref:Putative mfs monocarboxylate transporter protein n=1 Tax=Botrytis fragariae TaxID=1964551 RepID=A0A8H6EEW5_9HELO|nr:putative mfs monocarboxylate transporter protein [Botrytis fragariae]KAF5869717.1 putative mfs monocarboxylate transporter protein [Botrytis fragariae]